MKTFVNQNVVGFTADSKYAKLGHNKTENMYVETTNTNDKGVTKVLYGFGGYKSFKAMTGKCRGFHVVENCYDGKPVLFAVFGAKLYSIDTNGVQLSVCNISASTKKVSFAEVPIYGGDSWLVFVDGSNCYAVNTTRNQGSVHEISLPMRSDNSRIEPDHVVYLYGNIVVNDCKTDAFYTSCYHPLNTYDGVVDFDIFMVDEAPFTDNPTEDDDGARPYYKYGYVSYSEYKGDKTLAIISNGNNMYSLGESSLQKFAYNNVALSKAVAGGIVRTSPNSSYFNVGCVDANSVAQFGDTFFWVGKNTNGNLQAYTFSGSPSVISTTEMEREMVGIKVLNGYTFMVNGHPFYVLQFGNKCYAYDIREKGWVELTSTNARNITSAFRYRDSVQFNGKLLFGTDGLIAEYTEDDFTDCGNKIVRLRAGHVVSSNKVLIQELKPVVNVGDAPMDLRLKFSNDGKSFLQFVIQYAGKLGEYGFEPIFTDLGEGEDFSVELSTTSNAPFVIKDMAITYQPLIY